ncbi:MAG: hypothetical protein KBC64_02650 [Simkaniaceae bacterium]|nr:hypothetical protein [Simkaniaceae bacterium]
MIESIQPIGQINVTTDWKGDHTVTMDGARVDDRIAKRLLVNTSAFSTPGTEFPLFYFDSLAEARINRPLLDRVVAINEAFTQADRTMCCLKKICKAVCHFFGWGSPVQNTIAKSAGQANEILALLNRVEDRLTSLQRGAFLLALYQAKRASFQEEANHPPIGHGTEADYHNHNLDAFSARQWSDYLRARSTLALMDQDPQWAEHQVDQCDLVKLASL